MKKNEISFAAHKLSESKRSVNKLLTKIYRYKTYSTVLPKIKHTVNKRIKYEVSAINDPRG